MDEKKKGGKRPGAESWGQISKLASGSYRAAYVMPGYGRQTPGKSFSTKDAARKWLRDERQLVDDPDKWTPTAERRTAEQERRALTVAAYSEQWLESSGLRPLSLLDYRQSLKIRILPDLGELPLVNLDRATVRRWWHALDVKEHPRACSKAFGTLRSMMNAAVSDELIDANPCQHIKGAGKPSKRRRIEPLTPAQVQAVADAMPPRWRLGVLLGAWCALRSGEVRDLRRSDIDTTQGTVTISHAVIELPGTATSTDPKTEAAVRTIGIPAAIMPDVKAHLSEYAALGDPLLFQRPDGRQIGSDAWLHAFHKACTTAGIPATYVFHDLRHTGLTYDAIAGATLAELQAKAGHTTPAMAMRYQEVAQTHKAEVLDKVSAMIEAGRDVKTTM